MSLDKPIDKVTTELLYTAIRLCKIEIHKSILSRVIDVVKLLEDKGDQASIKDFFELQAEWENSNR